ncbi:MAG: UDP-glucose/GDP-mannose dehydrogenase family protein [Alphaproteobacteria bacterium]|nr:UDP-glucose/GDP-mannose dehydrogenase family protein [Alphaproteobacteria bacterium]
MKIAIIGTGYVGLPSGVGFAELGNDVCCIDNNINKIDLLNKGILTLYEDGLEEMFKRNVQAGRLRFTTSMKEGVSTADIVISAVGTPPHPITKEADLQYIEAAASELANYIQGYTVIATKSTVPVGTGDKIEGIIRKINPKADADVISLPEFLREGFAIHDFFAPDRIIVGTNSERARAVIKELYAPFKNSTMLFVNRKSSETIKYASNAFLAVKLNYINEMANFCEKTGADLDEVAKGMGLDSRIGNKFLKAGPGFGGSCFPKDTHAMSFMARQYGITMPLIDTTIAENDARPSIMAERILNLADANAKIAVLGLAFKDGTDDCRTSPAIQIISKMLEKKANITAYDPKANISALKILGNKIAYAENAYDAVKDADVIAILTEWKQFKELDWHKIATLAKSKTIMDCRNLLPADEMQALGFTYCCIGKRDITC